MSNQKLVTFYSHLTIWSAIYGILAAHVPFLIGIPWTTCQNCSTKVGCVLLLHMFDVPVTLYNLYVAWYGLKRFSVATVKLYISLLDTLIAANLTFFCFECVFIYFNVRLTGPVWEGMLLFTIALILISASGLALYIKQKLIQST